MRQQRADGSIHEAFSVELTGPVLPSTQHSLHRLFAGTQGDFVSSCSVQETTTPFNLATPGNDRTMAQYLEQHCGQQVDMETLSAAPAGKASVEAKPATSVTRTIAARA